jgi:acyl carrier protein
MSNTAQKVRELMAQKLDVDVEKIVDEARIIDDLGADSLETVELVMALEEHFGIEISDEESSKLTTVKTVVSFVEKRLSE